MEVHTMIRSMVALLTLAGILAVITAAVAVPIGALIEGATAMPAEIPRGPTGEGERLPAAGHLASLQPAKNRTLKYDKDSLDRDDVKFASTDPATVPRL